jgi:hypothetical protein
LFANAGETSFKPADGIVDPEDEPGVTVELSIWVAGAPDGMLVLTGTGVLDTCAGVLALAGLQAASANPIISPSPNDNRKSFFTIPPFIKPANKVDIYIL